MAAPSPPPTITPQPTAIAAPSPARALLYKVAESGKAAWSQQRPWAEVADKTSFSKPESVAEATSRVRKNLNYFRINYVIFTMGLIALSMLWNPGSLVILGLLSLVWGYLFMVRTDPLVISGRALSEKEKFLATSVMTLLVVFVFTSVGSILISALGLAAVFVCTHGAFRQPDDLFMDEPESQTGLLSFLGPSAPASQGGLAV